MRKLKSLIWLLVIAFIVNFSVIHGRQMPVGANGGDTIIHMGIIRGIYLGRNPFLDQQYNVPPNWYPFLYHLVIASLARITHVSIWNLMIWTPLVFAMLMVISWYLLGLELNGEHGGLILGAFSFLILSSQLFPNPKALIPILLPLVYLEILKYTHEKKRKYAVYGGILLGLMLWAHVGAALPVFAGISLYALFKFKEDRTLFIIPLISAVIILPYFLNITFHTQPGATGVIEGKWLKDLTLTRTLSRILPPIWGIVLIAIGLLFVSKKAKNNEFWKFVLISIGAMILVNLVPSLLYLAVGLEIFSSRFAIPLHDTYLLLYFYAVKELLGKVGSREVVVWGVGVLLVSYGSLSFVHYNFHNPSTIYASPIYTYENFEDLAGNYTKGLVKVATWINENTHRDDYLIGHPYTLEWISGFTGRPVVAVTYGHGNPFLNMKERREDIKIFFTNPNKRAEIIKKYGIKYVILGPLTKSEYNVTVRNFNGTFTVVFHWWKFYILEVKK